ncbi:MAG: hypothetical protein COU10_01745 [Candidatus Harrisonbacteria bacterium CG10_big_fil_rev_8_21_14_0_10_45_28]|uniref:Uncharacterized protein n=1 Tax=Candidatus Harrisonbacteria bacterium CG10_big_fil_rev_8_21_14_0_10_45_28 TaxID=1974586 RepID=A0A2H0UQ86_9BACT|nr:MAG: hypothetical protein COU10_01745 [Candidatus Harrisonbacteria bacterium CG10_big_fil_rev_8_21_14_0_10_45_28]
MENQIKPVSQNTTTIVIIAIILIALFFPAKMLIGDYLKNQQTKSILENGTPATGIITAIRQTGKYENNNPELEITLQINSSTGEKYTATQTKIVPQSQIPLHQVGSLANLKIDPTNPSQIIIVSLIKAQ